MADARDKRPNSWSQDPADRKIAALAKRQHGVVAFRQLIALGLSKGSIQHRVATGRLHRIQHGVYAVGHLSLSRKGHWMAAVLACGNGAVLSHRSAAALWQLRPDGWKTDVTVATDRRSRGFMRTHRTGLDPADITECDGIPVTTAARTLLDLASILDRDQLVKTIEESERRGLFDLQAVDAVLARAGHRPGTVALRSVLADYRDPADTRSGLERDFAALLRRSNVPTPQSNVVVEGYTVDCLWPGSRFIVELDSRGFHLTPRMFESDRLRDAKLMRAGYRVLRVTAKRLHDDPTGVLEDLTDLAA